MVLKTDLMELRKQLKKETCHIQRMAGVYVAYDEGQKVIKCKFNRTFLNLEDDEFYKYLELAKKSITGNLGESILELPFRDTETQKVLSGIIASELKDENLIEAMAQKIIDEYDYLGNYLIIFYYDVYDVPVKTSDKMKLDESEESYKYLICALCPMVLSKPGLGYRKEDESIGTLERDWILGAPENAFLYPSFAERSTDVDSITYMTKDKLNPHADSIFNLLGTKERQTVKEQQAVLLDTIMDYVEPENFVELSDEVQIALSEYVEEESEQPINEEVLMKVFEKTEIPSDAASSIAKDVVHRIKHEPTQAVPVDNLVDEKAVAKIMLKPILEESIMTHNTVHINVSPDKKPDVEKKVIDGVEYVMIPVGDDDKVRLNGMLL